MDTLIKTQHCHAEVSDTEVAGNSTSGHPARDGVSVSRVVYPWMRELVLSECWSSGGGLTPLQLQCVSPRQYHAAPSENGGIRHGTYSSFKKQSSETAAPMRQCTVTEKCNT